MGIMSNSNVCGLRRCTNCVLPETHETITFDERGVCSVCRNIDYKHTKIDWKAREKALRALLDEYRGKYSYDCMVPFSGGKDSTFTLYTLVTKYKVKPLVVSFDHAFLRPRTLDNNERTLRKLGVDFLKFRPSWKVMRATMLASFRKTGDFCWHCHAGVFAYPMQIAVKFNIPLLFWGEPSAEYTNYYSYDTPEEVDETRFRETVTLGIDAKEMLELINDDSITLRDLEPFMYPPLEKLKAINYKSVYLGNYLPWDVKAHAKIIKEGLDWQGDEVEGVPPGYDYEKVECMLTGIRDYIKYIRRGYARAAHLTSIDIRNGRMIREDAVKLVEMYENKRPASLDVFLEMLELSEDEFMKIARSHAIAPYVHDSSTTEPGKELWDQKQWAQFLTTKPIQ